MIHHVDTIIQAKWLLTQVADEPVLEHHALVINHGKIIALVPIKSLAGRYSANHTHRLMDHVVMPGLINAHTHSAMSLFRGLADDMPLMRWLNDYIWPAESKTVSAQMVYDAGLLAIAEYIKGGTTCINDMYFYANHLADALHETGLRARVANTVFNVSTPWAPDVESCFAQVKENLAYVRDLPLVEASIAPHAPYTTTAQIMLQTAEIAVAADVPIHIHLHETAGEVADYRAQYGMSPIAQLHELGILQNTQVIAVHMTCVDDNDMALVADSDTVVVHCPESNMKLASGVCPAQTLLDRGVSVALGTDGAASNNDLDMFGEMRSAAMLGKIQAQDPQAIAAGTALHMATTHGAKALAMPHIGRLAVDMAADVIAVDLSRYNTQPCYHPQSHLVYACNTSHVSDVWVNGKQLLKQGTLTTIDETTLAEKIAYWQQKSLNL